MFGAAYAVSSPRWSWCRRCNSMTWCEWDLLLITLSGVRTIRTDEGCVKEYQERKQRANGL